MFSTLTKRMDTSNLRLFLFAAAVTAAPFAANADLRPQEVAIIAARGSRESEGLAAYYAKARGVPKENICTVDMPRTETITREKWRWAVRPEIRKWLDEQDPQGQLRCLVTTWDTPLRIGGDARDNPAMVRYRGYLAGERKVRIEFLRDIIAAFNLLAPGVADTAETPPKDSASDKPGEQPRSELAELEARLEQALQQAQRRIAQLSTGPDQTQAAARLQQLATSAGGAQVLLGSLDRQLAGGEKPHEELRLNSERLRGAVAAFDQMRALLEQQPPGIQRDATLLEALTAGRGVVTSIKWLDEQLSTAGKNETASSFDSELSLVMWPDDYQLLRWQPNYLRANYDKSQLRKTFRTLMVARIDAPTIELAKGLIDTALAVEKEGLEGKVYLDARGIGKLDQPQNSPGSYADLDRALLVTAKGFEEQTSLEVVLDEKPELFQPGDCPDAALYCGWYSLGKYVDAFEWSPGAVAYHLASGEATTLRNPDSQVWCKRLLEDGVCATIGPTFEPYLVAFPRPNEFFALLVDGELTLVECYYRTKPFNSWMMTLIGDPLYRPFANRNVRK